MGCGFHLPKSLRGEPRDHPLLRKFRRAGCFYYAFDLGVLTKRSRDYCARTAVALLLLPAVVGVLLLTIQQRVALSVVCCLLSVVYRGGTPMADLGPSA